MNKRLAGFLLFFAFCAVSISHAATFEMPPMDPLPIAERIFKNECVSEADCLIEWNEGESFLSLGLGHFIWYPVDAKGIFQESFQDYLQYARDAGETIPGWLNKTPHPPCPWSTREQFLGSRESALYRDLLEFIRQTKPRQAEYLVDNAKSLFQRVIEAAPGAQRLRIERDLSRLSSETQGLYAIVDYVNFKGAGLGESERFQGEGWGLLQVMLGMRDVQNPQETLIEFVRSAREVLKHRVAIAPFERHEVRWLPGWLRRIDTYLHL